VIDEVTVKIKVNEIYPVYKLRIAGCGLKNNTKFNFNDLPKSLQRRDF